MLDEVDRADLGEGPVEPEEEEGQRHRHGEIEIRIGTPEEGPEFVVRIDSFPTQFKTNRSYPGNESRPVGKEDQDEGGGQEPEGPPGEMFPHDPDEKIDQALHQPFHEVLKPTGDQLYLSRRQPGDQDQHPGHHPDHHHGIGNRDSQGTGQFLGRLRQMLMSPAGRHGTPSSQDQEGQQGAQSRKLEG